MAIKVYLANRYAVPCCASLSSPVGYAEEGVVMEGSWNGFEGSCLAMAMSCRYGIVSGDLPPERVMPRMKAH